jgi:hypothetical protein
VVGRAAREPDEPTQRGAVDDRAASLLAHLPQLVLHARPDASKIDRIDAVEVVGRLVGGVAWRDHDAGVVEGHVEPPERRNRALDGSSDLRLVGNVADDREDPVARRCQVVCCGL